MTPALGVRAKREFPASTASSLVINTLCDRSIAQSTVYAYSVRRSTFSGRPFTTKDRWTSTADRNVLAEAKIGQDVIYRHPGTSRVTVHGAEERGTGPCFRPTLLTPEYSNWPKNGPVPGRGCERLPSRHVPRRCQASRLGKRRFVPLGTKDSLDRAILVKVVVLNHLLDASNCKRHRRGLSQWGDVWELQTAIL